jgi:hypothetical protein
MQGQIENANQLKSCIKSAETLRKARDFILLKCLDIVSSGQYRKFVLKRKDLCDQWAIDLHSNYASFMLEVRNLAKYPGIAKSRGHTAIGMVFGKLLNCVECPEIVSSGPAVWSVCAITKVLCMTAIRVNSASETTPVFVHSKFLQFCLSFWFASRFEHVLRKIIRIKYTKAYCDETSMASVSTEIYKDKDIIIDVVETFMRALIHVHTTIENLFLSDGMNMNSISLFDI